MAGMHTIPESIRAVVFDLDDTLFDFTACHRRVFPRLEAYAARELGLDAETFRAAHKRWLDWQFAALPAQAGCHSRALRFLRLLEERHLPLRHAPILQELYWNSMLEIMEPFPGVRETLQAIRASGRRIGIGTDMTVDWQLKKLDALGVIDLVDFVVASEETEEKPGKGLFLRCAEKAGADAPACLFAGDNWRRDILGALGAGMQAVWVQPDTVKRAEHPDAAAVASVAELAV